MPVGLLPTCLSTLLDWNKEGSIWWKSRYFNFWPFKKYLYTLIFTNVRDIETWLGNWSFWGFKTSTMIIASCSFDAKQEILSVMLSVRGSGCHSLDQFKFKKIIFCNEYLGKQIMVNNRPQYWKFSHNYSWIWKLLSLDTRGCWLKMFWMTRVLF